MSIRCRFCNCAHVPVFKTTERVIIWVGRTRTVTRRRRKCRNCGLTFTTVEHHESDSEPGHPEPGPAGDNLPDNPFLPST